MWDQCYFDPDLNPHVGQISRRVPFASDEANHCPFWIIPTEDVKTMILIQAARLILPLDHLFTQASAPHLVESGGSLNKGELSVRLILSFYTAQLFCRLLIHTLSAEEPVTYDNWIWFKEWVVRDRSDPHRFRFQRQGLGLEQSIKTSGMLWVPAETIDWYNGHISLDVLVNIYIPRSPLQSRLVSQSNVQTLTTSRVTIEVLLLQHLEEARQLFEEGQQSRGKELAYKIAKITTQEIARAYNLHMLSKMESVWNRLRAKKGRSILPSLEGLKQTMEDSAAQASRKVTSQTIWEIYAEAWAVYAPTLSDNEDSQLPEELPCWMTSRNFVPPKDSWSEYVFQQLFDRSCPPTWNRLYFLQLYRAFKGYWTTIETHTDVAALCPAATHQSSAAGQDEGEEISVIGIPNSGSFSSNEQPGVRPGRPRLDPAISPRARTCLRIQRHRDQQHLARVQQIVQELPPTVELSALTLRDDSTPSSPPAQIQSWSGPELEFEAVSLPLSSTAPPVYVKDSRGDGTESSSPDTNAVLLLTASAPSSPGLPRQDPRQDGQSSSSSSDSPDCSIPSSALPSPGPENPILGGFLQAIHHQDTAGGPDFLRAQGDLYDRVLCTFFSRQCECPNSRELAEPEHSHTLQERIERLGHSLPPLPAVFAERNNARSIPTILDVMSFWGAAILQVR
ncbi:hypothetical protein NCS56_00495400 [Fusarium sp. Ph1]|nr:hypothetical protein NCS56_00495400 [Fusarium sp. Ph1]